MEKNSLKQLVLAFVIILFGLQAHTYDAEFAQAVQKAAGVNEGFLRISIIDTALFSTSSIWFAGYDRREVGSIAFDTKTSLVSTGCLRGICVGDSYYYSNEYDRKEKLFPVVGFTLDYKKNPVYILAENAARGFAQSFSNMIVLKKASGFSGRFNLYEYFAKKSASESLSVMRLHDDLIASSQSMYSAYSQAQEALSIVSSKISKTDRKHLERFKMSLDVGVQLLSQPADKALAITNSLVTENARMIMVFSEVINQLMKNYDDVAEVKTYMSLLTELTKQIRLAYGWSEGLAGKGSKAFASLSYIVDLEIGDLIRISSQSSDTDILMKLANFRRATAQLYAKTQAKQDSSVVEEVKVLAGIYNSYGVQVIIHQLLNAPTGANEVQPRLKVLFTALESLGEMANVTFEVPTDETLKMKLTKVSAASAVPASRKAPVKNTVKAKQG